MVFSTQFICKPTREELQPKRAIIEKVITLTKKQFETFTQYPLSDYEFIEANAGLMYQDGDGVVHSILIRCSDYAMGYLVNSEGYPYARYAALYMGPEVTEK